MRSYDCKTKHNFIRNWLLTSQVKQHDENNYYLNDKGHYDKQYQH